MTTENRDQLIDRMRQVRILFDDLMQDCVTIGRKLEALEQGDKEPNRTLPPMVIGITGHSGSGKDTLANEIHHQLGQRKESCCIVPLAQELKTVCTSMLIDYMGIDSDDDQAYQELLESLNGEWKEDIGRPLFQAVGEYARRVKGQNYWIEKVASFGRAYPKITLIVPDIRYSIEADWIKNLPNGFLIGLAAGRRTKGEVQYAKHASEVDIERCIRYADLIVPAEITLQQLPGYVNDNLIPQMQAFQEHREKRRPRVAHGQAYFVG